jgi:hypothetical protein
MSQNGDDTAPLLDEEQGIPLEQLGGATGRRDSTSSWTQHRKEQKPRSRHHQHTIKPWFASIQNYPSTILHVIAPTPARKIALLAVALLLWLVLFTGLVAVSNAPTSIAGLGPPRRLSDTSALWYESQVFRV